MILRLLKKFAAAAGAAAFAVCADAADVSAAAGIPAEGGAFYIDFNFKIPPNEHIYSSKPSENGSPTTVSLKLPDGYRLESLEWPKPTNFEFFGMKSEGYSGDFTARAAANGQPDYDFNTAVQAFCKRKYESDFSKEMTRSAHVYWDEFE